MSELLKYLSLVILLITFSSCGTNKKDKTEIKFWGMGVEGEAVSKLIPEFEKENPNVKVIVQMIPWSAAQEKLISAYAGESLPDVFQLGNTWIPQFKELDAIQTLDDFIQSSDVVNPENYFEGIWKTNILNDNVYGIPWYIDTRVLFYRTDDLNKAGFRKPPATWKQLFEIARKIKSIKQDKNKYSILLPTNDWSVFVIFGLQNGAELIKNNYTYANFNSDKFREAIEYLIRFYDYGLAPKSFTEFNNIYQAFAEGYISMFISGPWNVTELEKWMKGDLSKKWMTGPLPAPDTPGVGVSLAGGASLVINNNSHHKNEAWKLIEFLSRPGTQIKLFTLVNDLPAQKKAWEDPVIKNNQYVKAFFTQLNHVRSVPPIVEWEQIAYSKIQQYMEYIVFHKMNINEALEKLDQSVNTILEKRRWLLKK